MDMENETELVNLDSSDMAVGYIDSTVTGVHPVGETSVADNATQQSEPTPDKESDAPDVPEIADIDEHALDQLILAKAKVICRHQGKADAHQEAEGVCWRELMPLLDEKQKLLTSRGKKSEKNITAFLRSNGLNPSTVRSWRRRLKKEQAALLGPVPVEPSVAPSDAPGNAGIHGFWDERVEIDPSPERMTTFADEMLAVLTGKSIRNAAMRIKRAVEMVEDLRRALSEGKVFGSALSVDASTSKPAEVSATAPISLEPGGSLAPSEAQEPASEAVAVPESKPEVAVVEPPMLGSPAHASEVSPSIGIAPAPDWKNILTHLTDKMEQYGDRLPIAVVIEVRSVRKLIEVQTARQATDVEATQADGERASRGYRVEQRAMTNAAGVVYAVVRDGAKAPYGYYVTRSEADGVCASLNRAPVASILDVSSLGGEQWRGVSA
jgi:hypothetical protein